MLSQHVSRAADLLEGVSSGALLRSDPKAKTAIVEALAALKLEIADERPRGWEPHRYRIAMQPNGWCEVDGMRWQPHNLGVHIWTNGTVDVTHIPSGKRLASFPSLGAAMGFAESIDDLYDWNLPTLDNLPHDMERLVKGSIRVHQEEAFIPRPVKIPQSLGISHPKEIQL